MTTVIRDASGKTINIGEWNYMEEVQTDEGGYIFTVTHNPLPDGCTFSEEEINTLPDGGLIPAIDVNKE